MSIYDLEKQRFKYVPVSFLEKDCFRLFFSLEQNVAPLVGNVKRRTGGGKGTQNIDGQLRQLLKGRTVLFLSKRVTCLDFNSAKGEAN